MRCNSSNAFASALPDPSPTIEDRCDFFREISDRSIPGGTLEFQTDRFADPPVLGAAAGNASFGGPVLSTWQNQQAFVDLRFGMFIHFNLGTFTDQEWARPNQNPALFAPTAVNCDQWAAAAKSAGMTFAVLTTKHHDGFALWPTRYGRKNSFGTYQNVMYSGYKHDVVQMYVDAFRKAGVTPCLYFSIWDRTEGIDSGKTDSGAIAPAQMATITGELTELLTKYGTIPLIMFDGWTWMTGRQQVAWQTIRDTVRALQPNILICDHNGLTQPFEEDILNFEHFKVPATNTFASTQGNKISGSGWFWHTPSFSNGAGNGGVHRQHAEGHHRTRMVRLPARLPTRPRRNPRERSTTPACAWSR